MINVNTSNAYGSTKEYNHGIEACKIQKGDKLKDLNVEIKGCVNSSSKISVAYQFMKQMGDAFQCPPKYSLNIQKMLCSCIGIHRTYCETYNCKENYIQVCDLALFSEGRRLFSKYKVCKCNPQLQAELQAAGYNIISENDVATGITIYYWEEEQLMSNYAPTKLDYYLLATKLREKGLWYFTDGDKYKTFISTEPLRISTESIIYCLMFFFGSITRYHPYLFDSLLTEQQMWVISEFLKTQPKQFLYMVTSRTIESSILKPNTANLINL